MECSPIQELGAEKTVTTDSERINVHDSLVAITKRDMCDTEKETNLIKDHAITNISPEKLRFGIDTILRGESKFGIKAKERRATVSLLTQETDGNARDLSEKLSPKGPFESGGVSQSSEHGDEDDEENDLSDLDEEGEKNLSSVQLSALGLSCTSYSSYMGHMAGHPALRTPSSFYPAVLQYASSALPWSTIQDIRKDRFGVVRRIGHPYQNRTPPKRKKPRTSFTRLQIMELEKRFERQKYLASSERSSLAKTLKMTDAQVKTWFQNRRTKWRRQTAEEREMERQAANRLLLSLQADSSHPKSMLLSPDRLCLSQLQRWQENRQADT